MYSYRVAYNQDCTNLFAILKEPITPAHVDRMVDEVADGGADLMLINPNAQRVCHPSRAWQTFWDGYAAPGTPGAKEFFGEVPEAELAGREAFVLQMKSLAEQGCDYLARSLARCRHKGIAPGVSVRMNDMHDAPTPGTHLFSRFFMEHREFWLDNGEFSGWGARGFDYRHQAVRDYYLALIRELAFDYDTDVIELDFLRFHCYFPRTLDPSHARIMTGFVRDVRDLLASTGRKIQLNARVPATPGAAMELGFDVAAWAREGIVDAITPGAFLTTQWCIPVDEFKSLVGNKIAVNACAEYVADRRPGLPHRYMPTSVEFLRGFAAGHLASGADGVELFNFFCARESAWGSPTQPIFSALGDMRALEPLRGVAKRYTTTCGVSQAEVDGAFQTPVGFEYGSVRAFTMLLAAEPAGVNVEVDAVFAGGAETIDRFWLLVNHLPIGAARSVGPVEGDPKAAARRVSFVVPSTVLRDGRNTLTLRNENQGAGLTLLSIDVRVEC